MPPGEAFAFGPFELNATAKRLTRCGEPVAISARQLDLLCALVARAPAVLTKDELVRYAWRDVAVTDNSLEQAISALRRQLDRDAPHEYIRTESRRGYRFAAPVTRVATRASDGALDELLAPHRAWIDGRAALETLERDRLAHARVVFEEALQRVPDEPSAHVGLANALAMHFETTRAHREPDVAAIGNAVHHAREACRLDPQYGEAWATLGFVLDRTGHHADALAAGRRAVALEPDNWRHHVRLAYTSWGEERLRAARRTLALLPGFPMAHWLAATVHVARQAFDDAERELDSGIVSQEAGPGSGERFAAVALHWLRGLLHARRGDEGRALDAFRRELASEASGQLYARECCANTWYAIGAVRWRRGEVAEAAAAFEEAIARIDVHPTARIALALVRAQTQGPSPSRDISDAGTTAFNRALVEAIAAAATGDSAAAAQVVDAALAAAPPGSAGWLIPVEPLLRVDTAPDVWLGALARLRNRAA